MRKLVVIVALAVLQCGCAAMRTIPSHATDALPSWSDGEAKQKIQAFITAICDPSSPDYVPEVDRYAVFDMDGTLLCEKPNYIEVAMTMSRLRELATTNPGLAREPLYEAALANNGDYINAHAKDAILEAFATINLDSLTAYCRSYVSVNTHPTLGRPYENLFYRPMIDLVTYLQRAGFSVFVVSTSEQEFIRSFCPNILPVPKRNIVGTVAGFSLANLDASAPHVFVREEQYFEPYNANAGKAVRLRERGLGHALLAVGNSMGDYAMLDGAADGGGRSLVMVLDHDDPEREFAYRNQELLQKAVERDWVIVSMRRDFVTVFE